MCICCEHIWGVWVYHFWDYETFGFKQEAKYIDLKRPELQRYFFFNFCTQYFKCLSIISLDNWLPAATGSACFLLKGPNHQWEVSFLSSSCPHYLWNCPRYSQNCLCQQGPSLEYLGQVLIHWRSEESTFLTSFPWEGLVHSHTSEGLSFSAVKCQHIFWLSEVQTL